MISFARYQFHPAVILHDVWLWVRFTLSYRDYGALRSIQSGIWIRSRRLLVPRSYRLFV